MRKAQFWAMDLMIAVGIFLVAILVFFVYSLNYPSEASGKLEDLTNSGDFMVDIILSEGFPDGWEVGSVDDIKRIGILDENGRIDIGVGGKLEAFEGLATTDYGATKILFNTKYDYYFRVVDSENPDEFLVSIGMPDFDLETTENLIKLTRFSIYENKPVTVYLYIFE